MRNDRREQAGVREEKGQAEQYFSVKGARETGTTGKGRLIRNQLSRPNGQKSEDMLSQARTLTPQCPKARDDPKQGLEHLQSFTAESDLHRKYLTVKKPREKGSEETRKGLMQEEERVAGREGGNGTISLSEGWTYKGEYSSGLFHGYGELIYRNRPIYKGRFEYGYFHGHGQLQNCQLFHFLVHAATLHARLTRQKGHREDENTPDWLWYRGEFREGEISGYGEMQVGECRVVGRWEKGRLTKKAMLLSTGN